MGCVRACPRVCVPVMMRCQAGVCMCMYGHVHVWACVCMCMHRCVCGTVGRTEELVHLLGRSEPFCIRGCPLQVIAHRRQPPLPLHILKQRRPLRPRPSPASATETYRERGGGRGKGQWENRAVWGAKVGSLCSVPVRKADVLEAPGDSPVREQALPRATAEARGAAPAAGDPATAEPCPCGPPARPHTHTHARTHARHSRGTAPPH
jgi:hypothetical protein